MMNIFEIGLPGIIDEKGQPFAIQADIKEVFNDSDKEFLASLIKQYEPKSCVDVGCFTGASAATILASYAEAHVLCVDHFMGIPANNPEGDHDYTADVPAWLKFMCLMRRLEPYANRWNVFVGYSHEAAAAMKPESFDFIFIDAAHVYFACKLDITMWWRTLKPGGIMAGHDFDKGIKDLSMEELVKNEFKETMDGGYHPGVVRAVREIFGEGNFWLAPSENSSIWCVQKANEERGE